ncbi:hypothetical protein GQ44DRAFT_305335 [Phaeosphaeriaceae sp. PMI808]|nr:hypothetical protein GQ44DRAFT_305335 [Phaeosphaeriaceae sp. PMI808]
MLCFFWGTACRLSLRSTVHTFFLPSNRAIKHHVRFFVFFFSSCPVGPPSHTHTLTLCLCLPTVCHPSSSPPPAHLSAKGNTHTHTHTHTLPRRPGTEPYERSIVPDTTCPMRLLACAFHHRFFSTPLLLFFPSSFRPQLRLLPGTGLSTLSLCTCLRPFSPLSHSMVQLPTGPALNFHLLPQT